MPDEDDARALRELESRLLAEDAAFVQRFDAIASPPRRHTGPALVHVFGSLTLACLMMVAGSVGGAVAFTLAAAVIVLLWWHAQDPTSF